MKLLFPISLLSVAVLAGSVGGEPGFVSAPTSFRPDGVRVHGYIYDAGSDGGAGMNRFGEIILRGR